MAGKKDRAWILPVTLFVGLALLIGGMLFLHWLFHTPIDWGVAV